MKKCVLLFCLSCLVVSCTTSEYELARIPSPDGKGMALLVTKEKTGVPLPGPEPPRTKARWAKLTVSRDGKVIHGTGFEEVGVYQSGPFAFDLSWAPDSSLLAYRMLNTLRIIAKDGKVTSFDIVKDNALVSSFKWLSGKELLIVSKGIDEPLGMFGYPVHYHGYLAKSTYIKVSKVNLDSGVAERFKQAVKNPTFLFHSIGFVNHEISPYSSRVAFSDGANITVYDDSNGKIVAKAPVAGSIEGIWWSDDDTVILGLGLLSAPKRQFAVFNVPDSAVKDATDKLLPLWGPSWGNGTWFKKAMKRDA